MTKDKRNPKATNNGTTDQSASKQGKAKGDSAANPRKAHASTSRAVKSIAANEIRPNETFKEDLEAVRKSSMQLAIQRQQVVLDVIELVDAALRANKHKSVKPFAPEDHFVRKRWDNMLKSGMVSLSPMDNHQATLDKFRRRFVKVNTESQDSTFSPRKG